MEVGEERRALKQILSTTSWLSFNGTQKEGLVKQSQTTDPRLTLGFRPIE